jgi:hypothetical protein
MKNAEEIRGMLLERLRYCLRSPTSFGGEVSILSMMEFMAFVDDREDEWKQHRKELRETGAFLSTGIHGGFHKATRQSKRTDLQPASVYTLLAFRMGYLDNAKTGPLLLADQYDKLIVDLSWQFFKEDWTSLQILDRFGEPTFRWGSNDNYPCIFLYLDRSEPNRFCYFDFWAEFHKDENGCNVPGKHGLLPRLRNVRLPAETFREQFTFTRFGEQLAVG